MTDPHTLIGAVLLPVLLLAAAIDVRTRRIPNRLTGAAAAALVGGWLLIDPGRLPGATAWGMAVGGALALPALAAPAALGMGDAKLALVLGLALGPAGVTALLAGFAAAGLGAAVILARRGFSAGRRATLPLAPYLAAGGTLAWAMGGA